MKYLEELRNNLKNKCLICCRSEFIQKDQEDLIKYFGRHNIMIENAGKSIFVKRYIAPLLSTKFDFEEYLSQYYQTKKIDLTELQIDQIARIVKEKNHKKLMNTSFMVFLTLEVLPEIIIKESNIGQNITRSSIYQKYIERKIAKLPEETKNLMNLIIFEEDCMKWEQVEKSLANKKVKNLYKKSIFQIQFNVCKLLF